MIPFTFHWIKTYCKMWTNLNRLWKSCTGIGCLLLIVVTGLWSTTYVSRYLITNGINITTRTSVRLLSQQSFSSLDMAKRRAFVRERCKEVRNWPEFQSIKPGPVAVLMESNVPLITCNNHKVGSTSITQILYNLSNYTTIGRLRYRKLIAKYLSVETINNTSYPAVMFVRNPLERLFSAYRDNRAIPYIKGRKISFIRFLKYVLNRKSKLNSHHQRFFDRCRPCDVEYDVFGTIDTYEKDVRYIMQNINVNVSIVPRYNTKDHVNYLIDRTIDNLPKTLKDKIWEMYKVDYYLFGYPHP